MRTEHKGYTITYNEDKEVFEMVGKEGERYSDDSIKKVKGFIDKLVKKAFKRVKIIHKDRWNNGELHKGEITSVTPRGEAWVIGEDGSRHKSWDLQYLYPQTIENVSLYDQISDLNKQKEEIDEKISECLDQMKKFTKAEEAAINPDSE